MAPPSHRSCDGPTSEGVAGADVAPSFGTCTSLRHLSHNPAPQVYVVTKQCLNAVAVGQLLVDAARVVRVEEVILVVILVRLPLREGEADGERDAEEDEEERVVVDTEGLARALTTRLIARKRPEVERAVDAKHRLGMHHLRVGRDSRGGERRRNLRRLWQLDLLRQLEGRGTSGADSEHGELHGDKS